MRDDDLLLVANSRSSADMLYAVGLFIPDPFIYFRHRGRHHIVLNDSELARGRRVATHCRVLPLTRYQRRLAHEQHPNPGLAAVIRLLCREHAIAKFLVPSDFPLGLARELRRLKVRVKVRRGELFLPQREFKTADEVKKISAALMMAEVGMAEGIQALRTAKVGPGARLIHRGAPLTSERLRAIIEVAIIQAGGQASQTIVAGGTQACDPHEPGSGPLRANQPIVLDIFPRSQKTGYFGDITRTVVKGRASEPVRRLYHAVQRGQDLAFGLLRDGAKGHRVHTAVADLFAKAGYRTCRHNGRLQGFFHGIGHGLGLEIHEPPRIAAASNARLRTGQVVTIEPGLYYPGVGGVRLEDVAHLTERGPRNLTKFEKVLEV